MTTRDEYAVLRARDRCPAHWDTRHDGRRITVARCILAPDHKGKHLPQPLGALVEAT